MLKLVSRAFAYRPSKPLNFIGEFALLYKTEVNHKNLHYLTAAAVAGCWYLSRRLYVYGHYVSGAELGATALGALTLIDIPLIC